MANPFVTSYQNVANVLAILLTQEEAARAWISDHYVQLVFKSNNTDSGAPVNFLEAMPNGRMSTVFSCPFLETQKLERKTVDFAKRDFIYFIKYCIDDGLYISVVLNHYHLPSSASYQKQVNCHQVYIYGYDEKTVYIADFFHGRYQFGTASYDEINEAYRTVETGEDAAYWITMITLSKFYNCGYRFQPDLLTTSLEGYRDGVDPLQKYRYDPYYRDSALMFGLRYYDGLAEQIGRSEDNRIDVRLFHMLYDHKLFHRYRLAYLKEHGLARGVPEEQLEKLIESSELLRNLVIKYNVTGAAAQKEKIIGQCLAMKNEDRAFTEELLAALREQ